MSRVSGYNSHERIIDGNNKHITSALQLLVVDVTWDVAVGA
jgi:hypothetical protein